VLQTHPDITGSLAAQSDLEAVDGVDGRIAGGRATYDYDTRIWSKAHVHKLVSNLVRQIKRLNYRRRAYAQFAQCAQRKIRVDFSCESTVFLNYNVIATNSLGVHGKLPVSPRMFGFDQRFPGMDMGESLD
jgi:hypothetical protein